MTADLQEMHSKASARTTTAKDMIVAKGSRGVMIFLTFKTHQKMLALLAKEETQKCAKKGHMAKHYKMREEAHQGLRETIRATQDPTTATGVNVTIAEIDNLTPIVEISTLILSLRCMLPDSKEELANPTSNKLLQNLEESERLP